MSSYQPHLYAVRDTLIDLMTSNNYRVNLQEFEFNGGTATNVIGRKSGLGDEATTFIMDAHYDAHDDAPGADDNGSGVVGFLEAMFLLSDFQFDKSIEFIGFDQEETGLLGSINYSWLGGVESWKRVEAVLNYEMIGYYSERPNSQEVPLGLDVLLADQYQELIDDDFRGNFIFLAANDESAFIPELFSTMAETYVPNLKVISAVVPLNGLIAPDLLRSDHAPFWFKGIPGVMITDGSEFRNRNYHTPDDVIDSLNFQFMRQVTQTGLATLIELAGLRHAGVETFVVKDLVTSTENNLQNCVGNWYPNPTRGLLRIDLQSCFYSNEPIKLTMVDVLGKVVMEQIIEFGREMIEVQPGTSGTYMIVLETSQGKVSNIVQIYGE